jgi:hypothetical protein
MYIQPECKGYFTDDVLRKVAPIELYNNYQATLFEKQSIMAGIEIINCPFCTYFEEKHVVSLWTRTYNFFQSFKSIQDHSKILPVFLVILLCLVFDFADVYLFFMTLLIFKSLSTSIDDSVNRFLNKLAFPKWAIPLKDPVFNCKNPLCLKSSCINCQQEFIPLHKCYEKELDSLRLYIESAMSLALIRTV